MTTCCVGVSKRGKKRNRGAAIKRYVRGGISGRVAGMNFGSDTSGRFIRNLLRAETPVRRKKHESLNRDCRNLCPRLDLGLVNRTSTFVTSCARVKFVIIAT